MKLLELLGLPAMALAVAPDSGAPQPPPPATATGNTKGKGKGKKAAGGGSVTLGDATAVSSHALGYIGFNGHEYQVWGFTDPDGTLVRGGSTQPMRALSELNAYAMRGVELVMGMQELEDAWRSDVDRLHRNADAGAAKLGALEQVLPAMTERMATDSDFFQNVDAYNQAIADAAVYPDKLQAQANWIDEKQKLLKATVLDQQKSEAEAEAGAAAGRVAAAEASVKEAAEIFKTSFAIILKLKDAKWSEAAEKAIEFVGVKVIGAAMAGEIDRLKTELASARGRVSKIADAAYATRIEAARLALEATVGEMKTLQKQFSNALDRVAAQQANAQNELGDSKKTAVVGEMIGLRAKQVAVLLRAKAACAVYAGAADKGKAKVSKIGDIFGKIGSFLDEAEKTDSTFDRSKPYATSIENSARRNADTFYRWIDTISVSKAECQKAIAWMETEGDKSPLGAFATVLEVAKQGTRTARGG